MVMGENGGAKCFPAGWSLASKPCDSCKTAAALLFCRSHAAFMCMGCDAKVHAACELSSPHERVWMCEVCEHAPASVTCKADAAALCVTCDRDIHSANPLARRHERVPVVPFIDTADSVVKSTAAAILVPANDDSDSSFLLSNTITSKFPTGNPTTKSMEFLISESDQFLDLDYPIPTDPWLQLHPHNSRTDSVVPVQVMKPDPQEQIIDHSPENRFEIDFSRSNFNSFNNSYCAVQSLSQSVSSSSMEVGVVPDGCSMSEISYPFSLQRNSSIDLSCPTNGNQASQLSGMDRKARVMRYREKRKTRKFEKTIRYASRKAYAETRPRIKGRFAKRTDTESEFNPWFNSGSTDLMGDTRYGVVPSF